MSNIKKHEKKCGFAVSYKGEDGTIKNIRLEGEKIVANFRGTLSKTAITIEVDKVVYRNKKAKQNAEEIISSLSKVSSTAA
jgi:hypothetical protein